MEWVRMFKDGHELTADLARPGQAHIVATEEAIAVLPSLWSSTNIYHHMLPSFSYECLLHDILQMKETGSQHADSLWTGSESHPPYCKQSSAAHMHAGKMNT